MWNRILDLYGYCSLLAGHLTVDITEDDETGGLLGPDQVPCSSIGSLYSAWSKVQVLPDDSSLIPWALLNPKLLMKLNVKGEVSAETS